MRSQLPTKLATRLSFWRTNTASSDPRWSTCCVAGMLLSAGARSPTNRVSELDRAYGAGNTIAAVEAKTGIPHGTIQRALKTAGDPCDHGDFKALM